MPATDDGGTAPADGSPISGSAAPGSPISRTAPRTVLVSGLGGAGRSTVAAATALAAARTPGRTLLLSAEPAQVLEPLLGAAPGGVDGAAEVAPGVWAARVDSGADFRARAAALQEQARTAFEMLGAEALDDDELTELPGAEALALLHALRTALRDGDWDTVVVDLPPARRAVGLLALPEQARRYLRRLLPAERQAARALRPMLAQLAGVPMPSEWLYGAAARLEEELRSVQELLEHPRTELRLVAEPGPQAAPALAEARAGCALHGLRLTGIVANRLFPTGGSDPFLGRLSGQQQAALKELREDCAGYGVPLYELPHLGRDPRGAEDLARLAQPAKEAPGAGDRERPADGGAAEGRAAHHPVLGRVTDRLRADGLLIWELPLPGARKDALGLVRRGDELIVTTGPFRRALPLPSALRRCRVAGAALEAGELRVRFAPDPALWPSSGAPPFG
ncbi:ArsA-related P-loop ATPase [Streptomyces sp. ODS28]|uniref:ArsA family ATPase n=1 Tax=Streptomyces sp. ODS28 TaxID=3136688 RepID=UPI0031E97F16